MGQSLLAKYRHIVTELSDYQGILFETDGLQKSFGKGRKENKAVFCRLLYQLVWSCKMMSSKVFPDKQAGDFLIRVLSVLKSIWKKGRKKLAQNGISVLSRLI